jgi:hypothetical protein
MGKDILNSVTRPNAVKPVTTTSPVLPVSDAQPESVPSARSVIRLQGVIGNQAVQRMLTPKPAITPQASTTPVINRGFFDDVLNAVGLGEEEEETEETEAESEGPVDEATTDEAEETEETSEELEEEEVTSSGSVFDDILDAIGMGESEEEGGSEGTGTEEEESTSIIDDILEAVGLGGSDSDDIYEEAEAESEEEGQSLWDTISDFIDEVVTDVEGAIFRWTRADRARISAQIQPNVLTTFQAGRIEGAVNRMEDDAYDRFRIILGNANSDMEFAFICKALSAGHTIDEVEEFADTINGLGERWMIQNLNVVDEATEEGETGTGIQQQFGNSCGPTSLQLIRAQADPIYALALHSAGPVDTAVDDAKSNPENSPNSVMSDEQNAILQGHADKGTGNAATDRSNPTGGAWVEEDMNALAGTTGLTFTTKIIGTAITLNEAIDVLKTNLTQGIHVPIVVGGSVGDTAHYVVALNWAQNRIQIHDVWAGSTVWRTEEDLRNSTLNLPSNHTMLTAVDEPTRAEED